MFSPHFFSYSDESRGCLGLSRLSTKPRKLQKLEIINCLSGAVLNDQTHTLIQANCPLAKQLANLLTLSSAKRIVKIKIPQQANVIFRFSDRKKVMFLCTNVSLSASI